MEVPAVCYFVGFEFHIFIIKNVKISIWSLHVKSKLKRFVIIFGKNFSELIEVEGVVAGDVGFPMVIEHSIELSVSVGGHTGKGT